MSSFVRVRACPNPNTFFDEVIPAQDLSVDGWKLEIRRLPSVGQDKEGKDAIFDVAWLYAESNYEEEKLPTYRTNKLPELNQILQSLAGIRQLALAGDVSYGIICHDFVKDGVCSNVEPFKINVGIGILNHRTTDADRNVLFDAKINEAEQARQALFATKEELRIRSAGIIKHFGDGLFRRTWESFSLALRTNDHDIGHLYDVRDALIRKFGNENAALQALDLSRREWNEFGKIFNNGAVLGGRHNGMHPAPMKPMTAEQRAKVIGFAKTMLFAFCDYLEAEKVVSAEPSV